MKNLVIVFVIGCVLGALAAAYLTPEAESPGSVRAVDSLPVETPRRAEESPRVGTGRSGFAMSSLQSMARWAEEEPRTAINEALGLTDAAERLHAVKRIGAVWARHNPEAALAHAATLPFDLRGDFQSSVAGEWANLDPDGFLAHAETAASLEGLEAGLQRLIATDARRVLDLAGRPSRRSELFESLRAAALRQLLETGPASILNDLESMPPGEERSELLLTAVAQYARVDPEAAIAWLDTFESPLPFAHDDLIEGIAATDFDRAYALATEDADGLFGAGSLVAGALEDPDRIAEIAGRLARLDDQHSDQVLSTLLPRWTERQPDRAVNWLIANREEVSPALVREVAERMAATDLASALGYIDRVPPEWRDLWITQSARLYAGEDTNGAIEWLTQFRGEPVYDAAVNQVINPGLLEASSWSDPRAAAELARQSSPAQQAASATLIGRAYARQDPEGAARWALELGNEAAVANAVNAVALQWADDDAPAAQRWVLDLPAGQMRDEALARLMRRNDLEEIDPTRFLDEFSSPAARADAVRMAVRELSSDGHVERRDRLLGAILDDAELGEWAEAQMSEAR